MCGISGVLLRAGETAEKSLLEKMALSMQTRGPDAQGVLAKAQWGFAHRRLRILDLSTEADQPFVSEDKRVSLVFNGEIYNFQEIRRELEGLGALFKTSSDTEVILRGYLKWGIDVVDRLNGMFAFALMDETKSDPVLHLVRDRFGIKPLFYAFKEGRLAFSSELKPLMQVDWISSEIDSTQLFWFLKFSHVPNPGSIFKGVRQLSPGYRLELKRGELSKHRFYDSFSGLSSKPNSVKRESEDSLDDLLKRFDQVLNRVVTRQVISDVPVGCFLSGGIDSSLLALTYSELGLGKIRTFTIAYEEKRFNEAPFARVLADFIHSDHHEILVTPQSLIDTIRDVPKFFDQPFADPTLLPSLILAREARKEVTVALSGDGGDELFFGYTYQRALLHLKTFLRFPAALRKGLSSTLAHAHFLLPQGRAQQWTKLMEILSFKNESELFQYFIGTIGPLRMDRLSQLVMDPPREFSLYNSWLPRIEDLAWREKIQQVFLKTFLTDTVLTKTDRAGMAYGLEARVPFLDDEMVAFAESLPFKFKLRGHLSKYLLREALARKFKSPLAHRKKQGFSIPIQYWLRKELCPLLHEYLEPSRLKKEGLLNAPEVDRIVRQHLDEQANHSHLIWSLLTFQMWKERYAP